MDKALVCERCGGKRGRRKCDYCGTEYYSGPEIPEEAFDSYADPREVSYSGAYHTSVRYDYIHSAVLK